MTQAPAPLLLGGPQQAAAPSETWTRLHLRLRGRYPLVVIATLVVGVGCAFAGYYSWSPSYESVAQIKVSPIVQRIIYNTGENGLLPMYDGYVESQVSLMQSANLLSKAAETPAWKAVSAPGPDAALRELTDGLKIQRAPGSQIITIFFNSKSPAKSAAGVTCVVDTYLTAFSAQETKEESIRVNVLEQRRTTLNNELRTLRERINAVANEYGSDRLDSIYQAKLTEMTRVEAALRQIQIDRGMAEVTTEAHEKAGDKANLTVAEITQRDRTMQAYFERKKATEFRIADLKLRYGDSHPTVVAAQQELTNLDKLMADYAREYNDARRKGSLVEGPGDTTIRDAGLLAARERKLAQVLKDLQEETFEIGRKNLQLADLRQQIETVKENLRETDDRLKQILVEKPVSGRISLVAPATEPLGPSNRKARIQWTVLGGVAGFGITAGLIMGLTLLDRRYQHVDEARMSGGGRRLLGVLPRLPDDLADPEQASISAACVHQIRSLLQLGPEAQRRSVFLMTSAAPGDGKTSLSTALGLSFAGGGARTLLIDLDLRGRGLTSAGEAITLDRIGQVFLRQGLITASQLQGALDQARTRAKRLGETLIDMGLITQAQLEEALEAQRHLRRGVLSFLDGVDIEKCISPTSVPQLSMLPIGSGGGDHVLGLSPQAVGRLIHEARQRFPVVLIDSGPVPGCVESSIAAAQVDAVVFTLSRGSQRAPTERALAHLDSIGATVAGMVFNRAGHEDVDVFSSSYYSVSRRRRLPTANEDGTGSPRNDHHYGHMGPVALATARGIRRLPADNQDDSKK